MSTIENNIRFPGQYWDDEKDSFYNMFRDYNPSIGRYLQSDPIGLAGGINTYGYVEGNPIVYTDRFGLDRDDIRQAFSNFRTNPGNDCGCLATALGIETVAGGTLAASGLPIISYSGGVDAGRSTGATSIASRSLSRAFPQRLPVKISTPTIKNPRAGTAVVGRVAGRFIPLVGWGLLAVDLQQLLSCFMKCDKNECKNGK